MAVNGLKSKKIEEAEALEKSRVRYSVGYVVFY